MFELDVVDTALPELDFSNIAQANHDEITLREDHLLPSQNMTDMEDDFFGEAQAGLAPKMRNQDWPEQPPRRPRQG